MVLLALCCLHLQICLSPSCPDRVQGSISLLIPMSSSCRESEDTVLLVLKEIYQTQGITLDQPLPGSQ